MILITGASGGLGYEFAKEYAKRQQPLLLVARNKERLNNIKFELTDQYDVNIEVVALDLANEENVNKLFKFIEHKKFIISRIINNAAFGMHKPVLEIDGQTSLNMINLNVSAVVKITEFGIRHNSEIKILNVSSIAGLLPGYDMATYNATKAFITSYSKALNYELRKTSIQISVLMLGGVRTNFNQNAQIESPIMEKYFSMDANYCTIKAINEFEAGSSFIVPGFVNKMFVVFIKFLPFSFTSRIFKRVLG